MPRGRGISTVLGALLFTVVALLFIALALRVFIESVSALTEVASAAARNVVEERLRITVSYTRIVSYTASQAGAIVTPLWARALHAVVMLVAVAAYFYVLELLIEPALALSG